jgi:hypothetical protein
MRPTWITSRLAAEYADDSAPLEERWRWSLAYAEEHRLAGGHWAAYSIRRELEPNALAGTTNIDTLFYARAFVAALRGEPSAPTQDVFILFGFKPGGARDEVLQQVLVSNRPETLALGQRPLIWLGRAPEEQSIPLLLRLYVRLYPHESAAAILVAASAHTRPEMLADVAVVLEKIAFGDARPTIQREMVDALFRLPFKVGLDAIGRLAREHPDQAVRNEAGTYLRETRHD